MSEHSFAMKLFVWIAVLSLLVTAVAPIFYYLVPQLSYENEIVFDDEEGLNLDETDSLNSSVRAGTDGDSSDETDELDSVNLDLLDETADEEMEVDSE